MVTLCPFNLAPGVSLGAAVAVNKVHDEMNMPPSLRAAYQGTAQAFQASLANEPVLIAAAAVIAVYLVLGILYESYIHPLTILSALPSAGVGALLALIILRQDFVMIALIGIVLLIGIVKKNAILMIVRARGGADGGHEAGRRYLSGVSAAVSSHHDDHHGGFAGRGSFGAWKRERVRAAAKRWGTFIGGLLISQLMTLYTTRLFIFGSTGWRLDLRGRGNGGMFVRTPVLP